MILRAAGAGALALMLGACAAAPHAADRPTPDRLILVTVDNPRDPPPARAGATLRAYDVVSPYGAGARAREAATALAGDYALRQVDAWPIAPLAVHCVVFEVPQGRTREQVLAALSRDGRVRLAQPMQTFHTLTAGYNDPYLDLQRGFSEIDAAGAQRWSRGDGVRVAVIDTGIDTSHPDLAGRIASKANFVDADGTRFAGDRHGTAVAGVIASVANNRQGIVGVAPGARLLALKACWHRGDTEAWCNSFTLAQALSTAVESGAGVVNLSLGGPADPLLSQLVTQALARGIVVVGAVPPDGALDGFPVGVAGVIAVDVAGGASRGGVLQAPGRNVITLAPGGRYDFFSGASLAAAHVSGVAALLLAERHGLAPSEVAALLGRPDVSAAGSPAGLNACAAVLALRGDGRCATAATGAPAP